MAKKLWGGRFKEPNHPLFERFSSSLPVDWRLAPYDLKATAVHCRMLKRIGALNSKELGRILKAIGKIEADLPGYEGVFRSTVFEDVHSWLESELEAKAGKAAKKVHTARSRNDQVNQATRMYLKDHGGKITDALARLQRRMARKAGRYAATPVAGMTHLQKAQVITVGHWVLGYVEPLDRSRRAMLEALARADVLTLGSGALAGSTLAIDREWVRKTLGFRDLSGNSLDAVGSRDFAAEFCSALALLGTHLSRLAEDLLIAQMEPEGWADIPENLCTGSSMMPQKKNADFLELARGASAVLIGNATALLALLKGLPGSYNRDLQWDKKPLFESVGLVYEMLVLFEILFKGMRVRDKAAGRSASSPGLLATDIAERMVREGVPFREAHERVGKLVLWADREGMDFRHTPARVLRDILGINISDFVRRMDAASSLRLRKSHGGSHPKEVAARAKRWERVLNAPV